MDCVLMIFSLTEMPSQNFDSNFLRNQMSRLVDNFQPKLDEIVYLRIWILSH